MLDRVPQARLVAAADVAAHAAAQWGSAWFDGFWQPRFPDQISDRHLVPEPLPDGRIELESEELRAIELGHTDTGTSPCIQDLADPGSVRAAGFRGKEAARPAPAEYAVHGSQSCSTWVFIAWAMAVVKRAMTSSSAGSNRSRTPAVDSPRGPKKARAVRMPFSV